ncbi:hypothetical protein J008_05163 [Cryptococcus neoformans]|nr:hypothetical protein C362_05451 [Cryptococcus neoformans var. grubii Bt1]OXG17608.1 hypothetical protein C367_05101 [Cryptococcus neoformans var. grubii Ze90-1]OXH26352.1 hypothetical protein J008_05163 [Cryptococcus neoformans var. grubii]
MHQPVPPLLLLLPPPNHPLRRLPHPLPLSSLLPALLPSPHLALLPGLRRPLCHLPPFSVLPVVLPRQALVLLLPTPAL